MENKKEVNRNQTIIQIISVIIWTILLIMSSYNDYENMSIILISGASAEFLFLSSPIIEIKKYKMKKQSPMLNNFWFLLLREDYKNYEHK